MPLQSGQPGTYILRQLYATVGQVQFVLPHIYPSVQYEVYSQEPQLTVEPLSGLNLLHDSDNTRAFLRQLQVFCLLLYLQDKVLKTQKQSWLENILLGFQMPLA